MKTFSIMVSNIFGAYEVCEWEAKTPEEAISEFKANNPKYIKKGTITTVEKGGEKYA